MRVALAAAALAAAFITVPAQAATLLTFTAQGAGNDRDNQRVGNNGPYFTTLTGQLSFNPDPGSSSFSYSGPATIPGVNVTLSASVVGNELTFNVSRVDAALTSQYRIIIDFVAGYLNGAFPTSLDLTKVLSSTVTENEHESQAGTYSAFLTSGSLTGGSITTTPGTATYSQTNLIVSPFVFGTPEPGTWLMMLAGFGSIGTIMRRRRLALRLA